MFIKESKLLCLGLLMLVVSLILCHSSTQEINSDASFKTLLPLTQQLPLTSSSSSINLFSYAAREAQQQCSCPNCGCNTQTPCPKPVPVSSYVVLAAMEDCSTQRQVPAIGLVNIQSTSPNDGFTYCIVDEDNRNKAMRGEPFSYVNYKSGASNAVTCVNNNLPAFRLPLSKVYLIAKSSNLVMNTNVIFNVQMSCVIPPSDHVEMKVEPSSGTRFYVNTAATYSVRFVNQYNDIDTWQQGVLSLSDNSVVAPVTNGKASLIYTPKSIGPLTLSLKYTPSSSELGNPFTFTSEKVIVYFMAIDGFINVPNKVTKEFTVSYTIKDNDGTITPRIDTSKLSFKSWQPHLEIKCAKPSSEKGTGSVACSSSDYGPAVLIMYYDGNNVASSGNFVIQDIIPAGSDNYHNGEPPNPDLIVIAIIVLVAIILVVAVLAIVIGIVWCCRRRNATDLEKRVKITLDEEPKEEQPVL